MHVAYHFLVSRHNLTLLTSLPATLGQNPATGYGFEVPHCLVHVYCFAHLACDRLPLPSSPRENKRASDRHWDLGLEPTTLGEGDQGWRKLAKGSNLAPKRIARSTASRMERRCIHSKDADVASP